MSTTLNDVKNQALLSASIVPSTITSSSNGSSVDLINADGNCFAIQSVGAVSGTIPSLAGKIQESSDGSTWTDISGATFPAVTSSNNLQIITFQRTKRFSRYVGTVTGTTPSFALNALIGEQKKTV
jgi:hypothetical protein